LSDQAVDVGAWLDQTTLVICVGSGGVGKTTMAASIALQGALRGRRAVVLTIDPARRLANSLGLSSIGNEATRIDLSDRAKGDGALWAMMLDSKTTFDSLIEKISPNEAVRDRIYGNHVYKHMAGTFAGSQDYMATEILHDLVESGDYDLVVLDTPPVKNALDFLESSNRLIEFLDERILSWFVSSETVQGSKRWLFNTQAVVGKLLGTLFGKDFLKDLTVFFQDFGNLYEGFVKRHKRVQELFSSSTTQFVTVCAPNEASVQVAEFFQVELGRRGFRRGGLVLNQCHVVRSVPPKTAQSIGRQLAAQQPDAPEGSIADFEARLEHAHETRRAYAESERVFQDRARKASRKLAFYKEIERQEQAVNDLEGLVVLGDDFLQPAEHISGDESQ